MFMCCIDICVQLKKELKQLFKKTITCLYMKAFRVIYKLNFLKLSPKLRGIIKLEKKLTVS